MTGYQWDALGKIALICGSFCYGRKNVVGNYTAGYLPNNVVGELHAVPSVAPYAAVHISCSSSDRRSSSLPAGGPFKPFFGLSGGVLKWSCVLAPCGEGLMR